MKDDIARSTGEVVRRYLTATVSLVFFALGVTLMTRSQLGISPIQSVAYVVYNRLAQYTTLGTVVLCWNCAQVLLQWPMLGRRFGWKQLIQVPLSAFFRRHGGCDRRAAFLAAAGHAVAAPAHRVVRRGGAELRRLPERLGKCGDERR